MRKTSVLLATAAGVALALTAIPTVSFAAEQTLITEGSLIQTKGKKGKRAKAKRSKWTCGYYLIEKCCKNEVTGKEYCTSIFK